eukprot:2412968-Rhodomonas_salina.8
MSPYTDLAACYACAMRYPELTYRMSVPGPNSNIAFKTGSYAYLLSICYFLRICYVVFGTDVAPGILRIWYHS